MNRARVRDTAWAVGVLSRCWLISGHDYEYGGLPPMWAHCRRCGHER